MWEIEHARNESDALQRLLKDGWEPFAMTYGGQHIVSMVWLKRINNATKK